MNKRMNTLAIAVACLLMLPLAAFAQLPATTYGWNLGNTMEPPGGAGTWNNPLPTQELINAVADAGFNTIRIPCSWASNADSSNNINPTYMAQVKQVVDWSRAAGLVVIINNHWDGGWFDECGFRRYDSKIDTKLQALWAQIANTFRDYDSGLLFAVTNEPDIDTQAETVVLMQYYQNWVSMIRATGGNNATRWLVYPGPGPAIDRTFDWFTPPNDPTPGRTVVEVHYYDPYNFTIMSADANWGNMAYFWGQAYHTSDPNLLIRNSTWGEEDHLHAQFQKMQAKFTSQGIPVVVGEFGSTKRKNYPDLGSGTEYQRHLASRTFWNKSIVDATKQYGLKAVFWDNGDEALFDRTTGTIIDPDGVSSLTGGAALPPPGGGGGGCTPSTTSINSIAVTTVGAGGGSKSGHATVTVVNNCGNPVANATVTGNFTGSISQSGVSAVTNASGVATLQTSGTAKGNVSVMFCVTSVTASGLSYNAAGNTETCDSN